jgi:phospho-N-acetylmuramoyl-pentapeptide-transferase
VLYLPWIGLVLVLEVVSVMIQIISFKTRGVRVFKMAPLHHHFELLGWSNMQIVLRFLLATLLVYLMFLLSIL